MTIWPNWIVISVITNGEWDLALPQQIHQCAKQLSALPQASHLDYNTLQSCQLLIPTTMKGHYAIDASIDLQPSSRATLQSRLNLPPFSNLCVYLYTEGNWPHLPHGEAIAWTFSILSSVGTPWPIGARVFTSSLPLWTFSRVSWFSGAISYYNRPSDR